MYKVQNVHRLYTSTRIGYNVPEYATIKITAVRHVTQGIFRRTFANKLNFFFTVLASNYLFNKVHL